MNKKNIIVLLLLFTSLLLFGCNKAETIIIESSNSERYQQAIKDISERHYPQAMGILADLGDYEFSRNLLEQVRYLINGSYISNGHWAVGVITSNGGVQVSYEGDYSYSEVDSWTDIQALNFRGGESIEGITKEGKIITTSTATKEELLNSTVSSTIMMAEVVDAVSNWSNIKAFQSSYPQTAVALTKEGQVYAAYPPYNDGTVPLEEWKDIVSVADGGSYVAGLKSDGTVVCKVYGYYGTIDTSKWTDIVAISAGSSILGLKEDGTVVSTGLNIHGEANVSDWSDIIAISTSRLYTLGLKSDGTVVSTGSAMTNETDVSEWTDIVAISAGEYFSIGLKSDGTMVLIGDSSMSGEETPDVSIFTNVYIPQISIIKY